MRFEGTDTYVATPDLMLAVNAAIALERPLLVKGEPGTGKTMLAIEVARALERPLLQWHIKSTTKAQQGLYEYDAVSRLRDSQLGDEHVADIAHYIKRGVLWEAFEAGTPAVVLIDEIDGSQLVLLATGRISSDIVYKATRAGIPVLASVNSATSMALDIAEKAGITIVGRAAGSKPLVYTNAWRLT